MQNSILFITFYGPIDYIGEIIDAFISINPEREPLANSGGEPSINLKTHQYPYLKYLNDEKMSDSQIGKDLLETIKKYSINYIFWFFFPESENMYRDIKRTFPEIISIFYNFDDQKSINSRFIKVAKYMDYFIDPNPANEKKYMYLLDKKIYILPKFIHKELLNFNSSSTDIIDANDIIDVTVIVDDDYRSYDNKELATFDRYIRNLKDYCGEKDYSLRLYGDSALEKRYPDIYEDDLDILTEGIAFSKTKCIIVLDLRSGIDKCANEKLLHALIYSLTSNTKIFTNSHNFNNYITDFISVSKNPIIMMDLDDLSPIETFLSSNEKKDNNINNNMIDNMIDNMDDITRWVEKIIKIIGIK